MITIPDIELETPRLLLRPPRLEDFDAWAEFMADDEHVRFIGGGQPRPMTWRTMMTVAGAWATHGFAFFSVIEKSSGRWIGRLGPWCPDGWPGTEVGWAIVADANGKGYASEGAAAAMEWAFTRLGWREIIHVIDAENLGSKAVAGKLGSSYLRVGRLPEPFHEKEVEIWGQSVEQWRARRADAGTTA